MRTESQIRAEPICVDGRSTTVLHPQSGIETAAAAGWLPRTLASNARRASKPQSNSRCSEPTQGGPDSRE